MVWTALKPSSHSATISISSSSASCCRIQSRANGSSSTRIVRRAIASPVGLLPCPMKHALLQLSYASADARFFRPRSRGVSARRVRFLESRFRPAAEEHSVRDEAVFVLRLVLLVPHFTFQTKRDESRGSGRDRIAERLRAVSANHLRALVPMPASRFKILVRGADF